jgi:nitronate monooxygenase
MAMDLLRTLGLSVPLFQAGMGGVAAPALVAAVADAGAGGIIGLYKHSPAEIEVLIRQTTALTGQGFGINLVPEVVDEATLADQAKAILAAENKPFVTFYGLAPASICRLVRESGRPLLVQVGTPEEARAAVERGTDAVIVQGSEAGGHHLGTLPLADLIEATRRACPGTPIVVAGGIATGGAFAELAARGAVAALCGTLFVCARESAAHPEFKARVAAARGTDTVVSDLFEIGWPGRPHRVLRNRVTENGRTLPRQFIGSTRLFDRHYPIPRYSAAVPTIHTTGRIDEMALYCGLSCRDIEGVAPAAELVARFDRQARAAGFGPS